MSGLRAHFNAQELANVAWALARFGAADGTLLHAAQSAKFPLHTTENGFGPKIIYSLGLFLHCIRRVSSRFQHLKSHCTAHWSFSVVCFFHCLFFGGGLVLIDLFLPPAHTSALHTFLSLCHYLRVRPTALSHIYATRTLSQTIAKERFLPIFKLAKLTAEFPWTLALWEPPTTLNTLSNSNSNEWIFLSSYFNDLPSSNQKATFASPLPLMMPSFPPWFYVGVCFWDMFECSEGFQIVCFF